MAATLKFTANKEKTQYTAKLAEGDQAEILFDEGWTGQWRARLVGASYPTPVLLGSYETLTKARSAVREAVSSSDPNDVAEMLKRLTPLDRENWARDPNTSVAALTLLAEDKSKWVRFRVAKNPSTPIEVLRTLASSRSHEARSGVAANPNTPVELLEKLATDVPYVRQNLAQNTNTPAAVLESLAEDDWPWVCEFVAKNPNTPITALEKIARLELSDDELRDLAKGWRDAISTARINLSVRSKRAAS